MYGDFVRKTCSKISKYLYHFVPHFSTVWGPPQGFDAQNPFTGHWIPVKKRSRRDTGNLIIDEDTREPFPPGEEDDRSSSTTNQDNDSVSSEFEEMLSVAASEAERDKTSVGTQTHHAVNVSKSKILNSEKLHDEIVQWNTANVRRNVNQGFGMWPICHIIENNLLLGVKKTAGLPPNVMFFLKNDSVPIELNETVIPLSSKGFKMFCQVSNMFKAWILTVEREIENAKIQGLEKPSTEAIDKMKDGKPADVFLEDSISLPCFSSMSIDTKQKPFLSGASGMVKMSCLCFTNKFGTFQASIILKFLESANKGIGSMNGENLSKISDERVIFIPAQKFIVLVDGIIPFIKQCDELLEEAAFNLQREYGVNY